jgi:hypothetical protein
MKTRFVLSVILIFLVLIPAMSQTTPAKVTDSNNALHLLQPDYPVPCGPVKTEDLIAVLNRIYTYLDASTPAKVIDSQTRDY